MSGQQAPQPDDPAGQGKRGDGPAWLVRLARMFGALRPEHDELAQRDEVERRILGGPRKYNLEQLLSETGMDPDTATRLWRSMGFAAVEPDSVVFTDGDRRALTEVQTLRSELLVPMEVQEAVTRTIGQAMAGLADWQIEMLYQLIESGAAGVGEDQVIDFGSRILPLVQRMQTYIWRRHLAAATGRLLRHGPDDSDTRELTIGFADMVGFTRATRRMTPLELTRLIESFQSVAAEAVSECHGRVVKTVGDEVLFCTEHPQDGAEIALRLIERLAELDSLPELRIGLALGPVVTRFGDVYGEVVNIAARLTTHARPGRILVDRNFALALDGHQDYRLRQRRPLSVRGYRHLTPWGLTRA